MIKLKDILAEGKPPTIFVPRRRIFVSWRLLNLYINKT